MCLWEYGGLWVCVREKERGGEGDEERHSVRERNGSGLGVNRQVRSSTKCLGVIPNLRTSVIGNWVPFIADCRQCMVEHVYWGLQEELGPSDLERMSVNKTSIHGRGSFWTGEIIAELMQQWTGKTLFQPTFAMMSSFSSLSSLVSPTAFRQYLIAHVCGFLLCGDFRDQIWP